MKTETIVMCVVALLIGMLLANMLKNVCGCKLTEGQQYGITPMAAMQAQSGAVAIPETINIDRPPGVRPADVLIDN